MDIVQNSVRAKAGTVTVTIDEARAANRLTITVADDGTGIAPELLAQITDPFVTTRTTRRVGLGLSLFKAAAEATGGSFSITSTLGAGTTVTAVFTYDHIDRAPLGNIPDTVVTMVMSMGGSELVYTQGVDGRTFTLDTREMKEILEEDDLSTDPEILTWIRGYVEEGLAEIEMENTPA